MQPVLLGRVLGAPGIRAEQPVAVASWPAEPKTEPPEARGSEHPTRLRGHLMILAETYPSLVHQVWSATT